MQQAAKERRQAMFRTLAASCHGSPPVPAGEGFAQDASQGRSEGFGGSSSDPAKTAPKVLGLSASSTVEAPTLEVEASALDVEREGMVERPSSFPVWDRTAVSGYGTRAASFTCNGARRAERGRSHVKGSEVSCEAPPRRFSTRTREVGCLGTTDGVPHAVLRFGGRSFGVSGPSTGPGVHPTSQCGEEHGNGEAIGSSNGTTSSRTCPSSKASTSTTSRSGPGASRSFSAVPAYVDYAVSGSSGAPCSDDVSASCGAPDTDGAKAGPQDGQMDRSGHTGPHRGTKAGSHSGTEGVFYSGANGGSYDSTAAFSNDGTATFSKDGAAACYSHDAKAFDIDDPSGTTRGAEREPIDGYRDCSDASVGCIWTAAYANDGSTYATGGPIYADSRHPLRQWVPRCCLRRR